MIDWLRKAFRLETEVDAAERRWTASNLEVMTTNRCECGAPGVTTLVCPYPVTGRVRPIWRRCAEHAGVPLEASWHNGVPQIDQSRQECNNRTYNAREVTHCGCGTHVGEPSGLGTVWTLNTGA